MFTIWFLWNGTHFMWSVLNSRALSKSPEWRVGPSERSTVWVIESDQLWLSVGPVYLSRGFGDQTFSAVRTSYPSSDATAVMGGSLHPISRFPVRKWKQPQLSSPTDWFTWELSQLIIESLMIERMIPILRFWWSDRDRATFPFPLQILRWDSKIKTERKEFP